MLGWLRALRKPGRAASKPADLANPPAQSVLPTAAEVLRQAQSLSQEDKALALESFELGNRQRESGRIDAALQHYRHALELNPALAPAASNLGSLLKDQGQATQAEYWLGLAIDLQPQLAVAHYNLAMLRLAQSRWDGAAASLRHYLSLSPRDADAHYWLGNALMGCGDAQGARDAYKAALRVKPSYAQARWGDAMAQLPAIAQTPIEQAQAVQNFASALDKLKSKFVGQSAAGAYVAVGAQQPYFLAYIAGNHRGVLSQYGDLCVRLMAIWAKQAGVLPPAPPRGGKLRVGIVSAHIHGHSVWHTLVHGWLEHLDSAKFELHVFHTGAGQDAQTQWARQRVHRFHQGLGHWTQWVKTVSESQLDVLLYPEIGMDATTIRLSALRLARLQLASWGHPMTTGLPTIDAYISAQSLEPVDAAGQYSERLITLPRLGCCYQAFGTAPARVNFADWGIGDAEHLLLCAGTAFKYAAQHDALLVDIARRCQPCKLVFFKTSPEHLSDMLAARLRSAFVAAGLDFDQCVRFVPWQSQDAFFAFLDRTDVYLDSIGFSGFNTCMQAVERGTPMVAFEGGQMRGRFASGILQSLGLDAWVAKSGGEFVNLVERLALDAKARQTVNKAMVERRRALFNDHQTVLELGEHLLRLDKEIP